jgi:multidrug efflux pump
MISRVFIDRPIFAWVLAIIVMMGGVGGILSLPVEQFPDIAPPSVNVRATYPGASAETLESSVTQVIEQQLTSIDGLLYFSSQSSSSGSVTVTVTLAKGTNPDIAQVQVQNKVQQALPRLPQQVQAQGLIVTKASTDPLIIAAIYDESDKVTSGDIGDYLVSNLQDSLSRLPGVGDINVFGSQYAMRIWLDPFKLARVKVMPSDVTSAIEAQNTQVAAGQIGGQPTADTQMLNATVTSRSRLTSPEQFREIIVKTQTDGSIVRLGDVARVELGSESYATVSRLNGHPGAGIAISASPGADALKTAALVRNEVIAQAKSFPAGFKYAFPYDATDFIKLSVNEVIKTLIEAILLVVVVMFVFLQSWRATLIPAIAVPVVLLGTFGVLAVAGYSINTLTLFAMVLAIGLLVDDAIVVVENVERVLEENPDMTPREATIQSMGEIQTALIAIALVLSAVFLPMAFFGGSTGVIYRQFSITIVSAMVLSVMTALTLSPALAAALLKRPDHEGRVQGNGIGARAHRLGEKFNGWFNRTADRYRGAVEKIWERRVIALVGYGLLVALLVFVFLRLPTSFLPAEDQGRAQLQFTLPPGATLVRTNAAAKAITDYYSTQEGNNVPLVYTVAGQGQGGAGQNAGRGFIAFAPWDDRKGEANSAAGIVKRSTAALGGLLRDVQFFALNPPTVRGLGNSTGFTVELLNSGGLSRTDFAARKNSLLAAAAKDDKLEAVRLNGLDDTPTLSVDIDEAKVGALGLDQAQVDATLSAAWGGNYVNDFVDRGRVKRVYLQGDAPFRSKPDDLSNWYVRSTSGEMAPFSAFAKTSWRIAPVTLNRFNGLAAFEIQGQAASGEGSGAAMDRIAEIAATLPGTSVAWSGLSYQEKLSGSQAPFLYALSLTVIFLCLAALYESWSIPLSVLLVIPLGLVGAAVAVSLRGLDNDVFFQVGLLTTMGLSAKNAILIVEFAERAEIEGKTAFDAALEAARLRLRPIIMTSLAFIFGVMPLALSTGAGAKSRVAIGTAVVGGTITATLLAIFFVPLFFVLVRTFLSRSEPAH